MFFSSHLLLPGKCKLFMSALLHMQISYTLQSLYNAMGFMSQEHTNPGN